MKIACMYAVSLLLVHVVKKIKTKPTHLSTTADMTMVWCGT